MVDDVTTLSDPPITPVEMKELEKTLFDVNVFQWSHEEEPFKRMVRTQVDRSAWDRRLFPNPH
ncbi:unnamed protein product, partial [Sphagnum jensenii]